MINQEKLREEVRGILYRHNLTYEEFGKTIGISKIMVSYILAGKRNLKASKVKHFCEVWGIDIESLLERDKRVGISLAEAITDVLRIKKFRMDDLSELTGIDILNLSQIKRGVKKPTEEELEKLSVVLDLEKDVLDEGTISSAFHIIREQMDRIHMSEEAIDAVMKFLEREIQNRRYL